MASKWMVYLAHNWRLPKVMWALLIVEIPLSIAALALFGIADPDLYRTKLWQDGSNNGFNSAPNSILYAFANYDPVHVPLVWSNFMTQFNVVCAVLSTFILLVKSIIFVLGGFLPLISVIAHTVLVAIYAVAIRNQATPDLSDKSVPNLQSSLPWYLGKGCGYARDKNKHYCTQAVASFAVTCILFALFLIYLVVAIHSAIITKEEKAERQADYDEDVEMAGLEKEYDPYLGMSKEEAWEQNRQMFMNMPKTPSTPAYQPYTPRTTAFNQLSGDMGEPSAVGRGRSAANGSRPLRLRIYDDMKGDLI